MRPVAAGGNKVFSPDCISRRDMWRGVPLSPGHFDVLAASPSMSSVKGRTSRLTVRCKGQDKQADCQV